MNLSGYEQGYDLLVTAALAARQDASSTVALAVAFWASGQDQAAGQALTHAAAVLPKAELVTAADLLREHSRPAEALQLCLSAATHRSVDTIVTLTLALHSSGRPIDANRVLGLAARHRPWADVANLVARLADSSASPLVERALADAARPDAYWLADLPDKPTTTETDALDSLFTSLALLSIDQVVGLCSALCQRDHPALAGRLVDTVAHQRPGEYAVGLGDALTRLGDDTGRLLAMIAASGPNKQTLALVLRRLETANRPWQAAQEQWLDGQVDTAEQELSELAADPDPTVRAPALLIRALIRRDEHDDPEGAMVLLSQAALLGAEPTASMARLHTAWLLLDLDDADGALAELQPAQRSTHAPTRGWLALAMGEAHLRTGRDEEAWQSFTAASRSEIMAVSGHAAFQLYLLSRDAWPHSGAADLAKAVVDSVEVAELWPFVLEHERPANDQGPSASHAHLAHLATHNRSHHRPPRRCDK